MQNIIDNKAMMYPFDYPGLIVKDNPLKALELIKKHEDKVSAKSVLKRNATTMVKSK
jgi:hypothetical protein